MRFAYPGWTIIQMPGWVTIERDDPPLNCRGEGMFNGYFREFATDGMDDDEIIHRVFATLQFLEDHERRENFVVDGVRVFDPHEPVSLTGAQQDWWVESQSAVRGY